MHGYGHAKFLFLSIQSIRLDRNLKFSSLTYSLFKFDRVAKIRSGKNVILFEAKSLLKKVSLK